VAERVAMNHIWEKIKSRYYTNLHLMVAHAIFIVAIFLLYRIRIYLYIQTIYPDIRLKGLWEYCSIGIHYDSMAIFFTLLFYLMLILLVGGAGKIRRILLSLTVIVFIFFVLFSIEFFRVYETTFQTNFAGRELFSGLGGVIDSAFAEFSIQFYLLFFILSFLSVLINFFFGRSPERRGSRHTPFADRTGPVSIFIKLFCPFLLLLFFLTTGFTSGPEIDSAQFGHRYQKERSKKYLSMLHEFSMNPVYNLFVHNVPAASPPSPPQGPGNEPFAFGLDTDSIASPLRYARQDIIPRNKPYNIILYFFESTPYKYYNIKIRGRYVMETWHRLEKNSINFRKHYANYPLSANALISVFASAYDLNSKDLLIQKYPDIRLQTLPEILKAHGYRTCLIHTGGLAYAGQKKFLKNRKFDSILDYKQLITLKPYNQKVGWGVDDRAMINPGKEFIERDAGKPFLLVLMPVNPHHPYAIPDERFRITGEQPLTMDVRKGSWLNYLNSLHYADATLGMLVDELEKEGLMRNTLLFLFADHGEAFYQHRMNYNHPLYLYDENVHVPFLIYSRQIFGSPKYFEGITRHIDILPTILDILDLPRSPVQEGTPIFAAHREQLALLHTSWRQDFMGVVDRNWKYICRTNDRLEELYDLGKDPDEKNNLAPRHMDIVERYRAYVFKARIYKSEYYGHILKR
jgi:phosphoglycerol transferase MdoB-like AlkP superfamily enzyme